MAHIHFENKTAQNKQDVIKIVAVEGATLIESNYMSEFDEMWVVTLDKDKAFFRVKERNPNLSDHEIWNRLER